MKNIKINNKYEKRKFSIIILGLFLFTCCNPPVNNENLNSIKHNVNENNHYQMDSISIVNDNNHYQMDSISIINGNNHYQMDSIKIIYSPGIEANEYYLIYKKGQIHITSEYFDFNKNIEDGIFVNKFLKYINEFYIDKNPIILKIDKVPAPVTDHTVVKVVGYLNNKKKFEKQTTLYSNIEFNPDFIEFYEILDSLCKNKK